MKEASQEKSAINSICNLRCCAVFFIQSCDFTRVLSKAEEIKLCYIRTRTIYICRSWRPFFFPYPIQPGSSDLLSSFNFKHFQGYYKHLNIMRREYGQLILSKRSDFGSTISNQLKDWITGMSAEKIHCNQRGGSFIATQSCDRIARANERERIATNVEKKKLQNERRRLVVSFTFTSTRSCRCSPCLFICPPSDEFTVEAWELIENFADR